MTKLEQLINQLCPDGVDFHKLGEITTIKTGTKPKDILDYPTEYEYINAGTSNSGYTNTSNCEGDTVTTPSRGQGGIGFIGYQKNPFWLGPLCYKIKSVNESQISNRFIYYYLCNNKDKILKCKNEGGTPSVNVSDLARIIIPIPPLEVQAEIVRILDTFTELTTELTTELANRKKQYEYYLNDVFRNVQAEYEPMEKYFPFIRNGFVGTVTSFFTDAEHGVRYLEGKNIHNGVISDNEILYVTKDFHKKHIRNELKPDDILMVQSGHVGECAVVGEKYAGANCHALIIMSNGGNINSKYVTYYFMSAEGKRKLEKITTGGTIKHILASGMKKVTIPVPPIEEQHRIVAILVRFDRLCNDISEGLPAEIEARQKQYEYYRDTLLNFKEVSKQIAKQTTNEY